MLGITMTNMYSISSLPTTLSTIPPIIQDRANTGELENDSQERQIIHKLEENSLKYNDDKYGT